MMRYSHYIILLLASIFYFPAVLANDRVVDYKKLQNRNGVFYEMNTQVPFSGVSVLSSYESGQWRYITRYDTGKKIAFEMYFENGQLSFQRVFDDDKEKSISYHFNGIVKSKASSKDSNPFGVWQWFDKDGLKIAEEKYGSLEGFYRFNDKNQKVYLEGNYKAGKREGEFTQFANGQLFEKKFYIDNELNGVYKKYWYDEDVLAEIVKYKEGEREGISISYDPLGNLYQIGHYLNGKKDDLWLEWKFGAKESELGLIEMYDKGEVIERQCLDMENISCDYSSSRNFDLDQKYIHRIKKLTTLYQTKYDKTLYDSLLTLVDKKGNVVSSDDNIILKIKEEREKKEKALKQKVRSKAIKKIGSNWNVAPLLTIPKYQDLVITLKIYIDQNGNIKKAIETEPKEFEGNMLIAKRAALSAVLKSVPFDISKDEFPDGISLSITFDPNDLEENDE